MTPADAAMLPSYDQILEDESVLEVGRPAGGHHRHARPHPGSMCFAVEGTPLLFSGDTLFPGGPGNTKFEDADFATIIRSIEDRLFAAFDPDTHRAARATAPAPPSGTSAPTSQEWVDRGW